MVDMVARVKTGIPGFDKLVNGGLIKNSVNLLSGGPGTGKTIFALQFLYKGITEFNERGLFISCEESVEDIIEDAKVFGWDFAKLQNSNKLNLLFFSPFELIRSNESEINLLADEVEKIGANRVIIDSSSVFGMALANSYEMRKQLYNLTRALKNLNCTSIITSEAVGPLPLDVAAGGRYSRFGVEEFVCDGVIMLHFGGIGGESDRAIRIVKMRRTNHVTGPVPMKITNKGIHIMSKDRGYG